MDFEAPRPLPTAAQVARLHGLSRITACETEAREITR